MAEELRAGRTALMAVLAQRAPGRSSSSSSGAESRSVQVLREAEHFFSPRGSLEAVQDLKDTLFRGAARKLLGVSVWCGIGRCSPYLNSVWSDCARTSCLNVLQGVWHCHSI